MVSAINKAREYGKNICVIGFKNIIDGVDNLGQILGVNLIKYLVYNEEEANTAFKDALSKHKVDVVLGGSLAESMAKKAGMNTVYLETSKKSIEESILDAKRILDIKLRERLKTERFEAILNNINEGVVATDKNGEITLYNKTAKKIIELNNADALLVNIREAFSHYKNNDSDIKNEKYDKLVTSGNKSFLLHNVPIYIKNQYSGSVATFEDVTKIQEYEEMIRSNLIKKEI